MLSAVGCGGGGGGSTTGSARAAIVLSAENSSAAASALTVVRGTGGGPVPIEDIASLIVTVTEVTLQRCGGDGGDDDGEDVETVLVEDFAFDPTSVTIEQGGTVRWVWTTDTLHTITSGMSGDLDAGSEFDESAAAAGTVIELIFADLGEYPYFSNTDTDIEEGMAGTVHVVEDDDDGEGEGDGGHTTVFEGAFDVDILDLIELSEVLSMVDVPAGQYCRIIIRIENPRLYLAADPETEITNVHLTANGRLFIKDKFTLEDGDEVLIIVNFGSIHLVQAGNSGKYVLTPQLRGEVVLQDANVMLRGEIVSKDDGAMIIEVQTEGDAPPAEVLVDLETAIETDDDSDDAARGVEESDPRVALEFADLAVGQTVDVTGLLTVSGQVEADLIVVDDDDFDTEAAV